MMNFKILSKRIPTNEEGIFYKSIINENAKEVDKTYVVRRMLISLKLKPLKLI